MEILHQIGGLLVGAVPTMILLVLLYGAYTVLVRRPLERTLAERRSRTVGAVEQARGAIAAAEAESVVLEDRLRTARREINGWREEQSQRWQREREAALGEARSTAGSRVKLARAEIEQAAAEARLQIEAQAESLGTEILRAVLPASAVLQEVR